MKESAFIKQNKENWQHYEDVLKGKSDQADELNDLFIQVTDDLSYARSFYPNRSVRVYLNQMAQKVFLKLYSNRKLKPQKVQKFFTEDLPLVMFNARKELLVCFLVFILTFSIGVFSSRKDKGFARQILGENYVEMTKKNIQSGNPMAVYSSRSNSEMFFYIAYNNLKVDLLTFVTGLIFGIGALFVLAYNGIMVGVFQYFFYGTGYLLTSIFTIWLHGTLEIFAMILSATAGLVFGKGLIFPGSYSRLQAFRLSAVKGVKLLMGIIPITLIAAFIESYITGQSNVYVAIKVALIGISFVFIVLYFIWYPYKKFSRRTQIIEDIELPPDVIAKPELGEIKSIGEVIADSFRIWKDYMSLIFGLAFVGALVITGLTAYFDSDFEIKYVYFKGSDYLPIKILQVNTWFRDSFYTIWPATVCIITFFPVFYILHFKKLFLNSFENLKSKLIWTFFLSIVMVLAILVLFYIDEWWRFLLLGVLFYPTIVQLSVHLLNKGVKQISTGFNTLITGFGSMVMLNVALLLLTLILYSVISSPLVMFLVDIVIKALDLTGPLASTIINILFTLIGFTALLMLFPIYLYANILHYHSSYEMQTAESLRTKINEPLFNE